MYADSAMGRSAVGFAGEMALPPIDAIDGDSAPLLARPFFANGDPGPIVAILAHVPEALEVAMPFFAMVLSPSALTLRTKEIAILRTSSRASCRYCVDAHSVAALDAGLSDQEVRALRGWASTDDAFAGFAERALISWCDALVDVGPVAEQTRDVLRAAWADHEVVELTLLVGTTLLLNRFCTALELPTSPSVFERLATAGLVS